MISKGIMRIILDRKGSNSMKHMNRLVMFLFASYPSKFKILDLKKL
ncbi:hypothetical protein Nit79A3_0963 [Nitrosomonas sp. Is79A3]